VVNYRFVDLNNSSNGPYLFDVSLGKYVDKVNAQDAIDAYLSNRKNYPVLKEDKVTLDFPADYRLSDYVNYSRAYGAYIMAGLGEHYIVGTNYADTIVAADVGSNWYDGGSDMGYVKYVKSATDVTGLISVARDAYRLTRTVTSESNVSDTSTVSKTGIKLIRLSDKFDLLNATSASSDTVSLDAINAATIALKAKFNIGADVAAEYAVVKTKTVNNVTEILGVDLLRNIEIFQMRNWFDADGNTRPNGSEVSDVNYNTNDLLIDNTLYQTADQTFMPLYGVNYAGVVFGTSGSDTINLQSNLTSMLQANPDISNNNRGLIFADRLGNDTLTGTNFNDFFWLSTGTDSIDAGAGTQDRVGIYWAPSSTGGSASISTVTSTDKKTIKVVQIQGGTTTDLMRFTLNDSSATDKYWSVEQLNTTFSQLYLNNSLGSQAVTLRGVEQAVFALPSTLLNSNDQPLITLTGLTNNFLVVDLTVV
jgi:hypothetical protein